MGGFGVSVWVMGEWSVGQWILGVMRFQKIFGLYSVERHKVEKGAGQVMGEWSVVSGSVDSGCHDSQAFRKCMVSLV